MHPKKARASDSLGRPVRRCPEGDSKQAAGEESLVEDEACSAAGASTAPCILLVDDHETNRRLLAYQVGRLGYRSIQAVDGAQAVECLGRETVDLVLLDFNMPRLNGEQVTRWIREQPGKLGQLPIIGLTAGACAGDDRVLLDAGANLVLIKPVRQAEIAEAVLGFLPAMEAPSKPETSLDKQRRAMLGDS